MVIREKYIQINTTVAIVDIDNYLDCAEMIKSENNFKIKINEILDIILNDASDFYLIRLYGGWYADGVLTRNGSEIQKFITSSNYFPLSAHGKIIRGEIELASSLNFFDGFNFTNTYRIKNGLPKINLDKNHLNTHCTSLSTNCPARLLSKFTSKKNKQCGVNECEVVNFSAFKHSEQKMVDTMMSIDIVDYGENNNVNFIYVLSNDTDLVPSVLRCIIRQNKIKVIASQSSALELYIDIENRLNIEILKK